MNIKTWAPLVLAIVLGLAAAKIAHDMIQRRNNAPRTTTNLVQIVVAKHSIQPGQELQTDDLAIGEVSPKSVPEGAFKNLSELEGRVAQISLGKDQAILESLLAPKGAGSGLQALVPDGMRAMTIEVNEFSGLAGMLTPGCHVDVISSIQGDGELLARTIVQNVKVQAIGQKLTVPPPNTEKKDPTAPPPEPTRSVTLLLTPQQAESMELASATGRPRLVLRSGRDEAIAASEGVSVGQLRGMRRTPTIAIAPPTTQPDPHPIPIAIGTEDPFAAQSCRAPDVRRISVIRAGQETVVTLELPSAQRSSANANDSE